jgi:hypothetical protein
MRGIGYLMMGHHRQSKHIGEKENPKWTTEKDQSNQPIMIPSDGTAGDSQGI